MEDQKLIDGAQKGDHAALNALIGKYWRTIYRLAYYKTGNSDDAQEIAQETFLRAIRSLAGYKTMNASFKTYLGRITLNLVNDYWRKKGRTPPVLEITEYQEPLADLAELPEDAAIRSERRQEILALVSLLPDAQRQTVELRIMQGLSVAETAGIMGKSEAAVKMLQQRALQQLRKMFIQHGMMH